MIAAVKAPAWHPAFLEMLPAIQRHARISFRHLDAEAREEFVHEVVANSLVAFLRLFTLGKAELAYPSVLARYGAARRGTAVAWAVISTRMTSCRATPSGGRASLSNGSIT